MAKCSAPHCCIQNDVYYVWVHSGIGAGMGIGFTVSAGENPISAEEASRFSRIPGVTKTAYATKTLAQVDGASLLWTTLSALPAGLEARMPLPYMIALTPLLWVPLMILAAVAAWPAY